MRLSLQLTLALASVIGWDVHQGHRLQAAPPNVILILCDNLGNGDIACFNPDTRHRTPHLDRMAQQGMRLTSFYSACGVCSPSRAALMTGCYPRRVGLHLNGSGGLVLRPADHLGINTEETTLAELFSQAGYATACYGKWHLGDQPDYLPRRHGFGTYLGIPYSEDMVPDGRPDRPFPPLPLVQDDRVVEAPVEPHVLTERLTQAARGFIRQNRERPFFIYFPEAGPGSLKESYPGAAFRGKSANGLYGDAIEELDWSVGEILSEVEDNGLTEQTIIIWTSDNGAVRRNPAQGSNAPYSGFGYGPSEGGMRMPCIVRWPAKIPPGQVRDEICTMMDWLPTLQEFCGLSAPEKPIDGHSIATLLTGGDFTSLYDRTGFFYFHQGRLHAVRAGDWKLYLPNTSGNRPSGSQTAEMTLFDVRHDVAESRDMAKDKPQIVAQLLDLCEQSRRELGDGQQAGYGQRAAGWVANPSPLTLE